MTQQPEPPITKYWKSTSSGGNLAVYWFDAYGWIAYYFAQLEGLSYALIELLGTDKDRAKMYSMKYQARTERAKDLICSRLREQGEEELANKWDTLLTEAKEAAPMRNKILHNPMSVNLASVYPLKDETAGIILVHKAGRPMITLGSVQAFAKTVTKLNLRMQELMTESKLNSIAGN